MFPFTEEDLLGPVQVILNKMRPYIKGDGGQIDLVEIKGHQVFVRLSGNCKGCASSHITLKHGIERQLKTDIHPELEVIDIEETRR